MPDLLLALTENEVTAPLLAGLGAGQQAVRRALAGQEARRGQ